MKTSLISGFLLIIILSAYLIIPVMPVINYLINKDYIAKNLCVNKDKPKSCCKGKCHLVKQLQKTNQNTEKDPKNTGNKHQIKELNEFILNTPCHNYLANISIKHLIFIILKREQLVCSAKFVPPKSAYQS
jgi:hypothetical protein